MTYPEAFWAMNVADREDNGGFEIERDIVEEREKARRQCCGLIKL
jgi:hypothetical protein